MLAGAAPKGVLMVRDELAGWLLGMGAYNAGARAFWLESYGGRPYRVDRVKHPEPIAVPHLAVAWWGGVQPEVGPQCTVDRAQERLALVVDLGRPVPACHR